VNIGNDTMPWNWNKKLPNPDPNPLYPKPTFLKDAGATPSFTGCLRYQTDSGNDNVYFCADAINSATYGYNNLQWYGMTFYHKFNDEWHLAVEIYNTHQDKVPNLNNPIAAAAIAAGGIPFSTGQYGLFFNTPNAAQCKNPLVERCTAFPGLPELSIHGARQSLLPWRILQRPRGTTHGHENPLHRDGHRLAALVLAAARASSGGVLLPGARPAGLQRQR
jgi:hypothetical protein